ncbi:putative Prolyl-trna synthetase, partial [Leptomonas seymouri]
MHPPKVFRHCHTCSYPLIAFYCNVAPRIRCCEVHRSKPFSLTPSNHLTCGCATRLFSRSAPLASLSSNSSLRISTQVSSQRCASTSPKFEKCSYNRTSKMSVEDCKGLDEVKAAFQELDQQPPILEHADKATVDDVLALLTQQKGITAAGTKTLFLKSKKGELVMVTALREVPTDFKVIQDFAKMKDLRFANNDVLHDNLKVVQGCVTPFPLINNLDKRNITVLLDQSLATSPIPMAFCACRNDHTIVVTFDQLKMFMDKIGY